MKAVLLVLTRLALAIVGAVAFYVLLYMSTAWLSQQVGYDNPIGRGLGFLNGALSIMGWGIFAIVLFGVIIFIVVTRYLFRRPPMEEGRHDR